jgi:hypothetical protein
VLEPARQGDAALRRREDADPGIGSDPTAAAYASWLNQVERWFGIITQRAIRRGSFSSVKELIAKIEQFVAAYDKTKAPFNWTATADSILEKLQRLCAQISGTAR